MAIFTQKELINQSIPQDLQLVLKNFKCCENLLEEMEFRFFNENEIPNLISHSYLNDGDKQDKATMANVYAIDDVFKYISFIGEAIDGNLVGYWHGQKNKEIEKSPIIMYTTEGVFKILLGKNLIEALIGDYIFDDNDKFLDFQKSFLNCGINIVSKWDDLVEIKVVTDPEELHQKFYNSYINL